MSTSPIDFFQTKLVNIFLKIYFTLICIPFEFAFLLQPCKWLPADSKSNLLTTTENNYTLDHISPDSWAWDAKHSLPFQNRKRWKKLKKARGVIFFISWYDRINIAPCTLKLQNEINYLKKKHYPCSAISRICTVIIWSGKKSGRTCLNFHKTGSWRACLEMFGLFCLSDLITIKLLF